MKRVEDVREPICIILAAGRGTRMRSQTTHKVCFRIAGRPAILRACEAYATAGLTAFHVVVGALANQVMETVTIEYPRSTFVYQAEQRGTGHAARLAIESLMNKGYTGPVVITMGDKLIDPQAVSKLVASFNVRNLDAAVGVIPRQNKSEGGRILLRQDGTFAGIVESRDIQKASILDHAYQTLLAGAGEAAAGIEVVERFAETVMPDPKARRKALGELGELLASGDVDTIAQILQSMGPETGKIRLGDDLFTPAEADQSSFQNAAFYAFRLPALYEGLQRITSDNAQGEEYLTDAVNILANDKVLGYRVGICELSPDEILTYNNPEQLLAVEEVFRRRLETNETANDPLVASLGENVYRSVNEWLLLLQSDWELVRPVLEEIYGPDPTLNRERCTVYETTLRRFGEMHGYDRKVILVRAPGRINLMGRHIEHRGGTVNVLALNKEVVMVAAPRSDDRVRVSNIDPINYPDSEFSLGEELSTFQWDDWLDYINHEHVQRLVLESDGSWINYIKAALLRLQFQYRNRQIRGMDVVATGNIPPAAGLSSSSAMVVASAEAAISLNGLDVVPQDFVDLCGEGEWYVGSRGGAGDHAAVKFGRSGEVTHIGFFPFDVKGSSPFPEGYELLVANSHVRAQKTTNAKDVFNQRIASYELGFLLLKESHPNLPSTVERLRDLNPSKLSQRPSELYKLLLTLPERMTQEEALERLGQKYAAFLHQLFGSHAKPDEYVIRSVLLYGVAECARAELCRQYLASSDVEGLGRLMRISHDGDRVARFAGTESDWRSEAYDFSAPDAYLHSLIEDLKSEDPERVERAQVHMQPGGYACSTPEIDEMVDLALTVPGVAGAQLSGAGLGGCIMVLVKSEAKDALRETLKRRFYEPRGLSPEITESVPVRGAMLFGLTAKHVLV